MMAAAPWPRGGCPGPVPSMLLACVLSRSLGTTKGLVLCGAGGLRASGGVKGLPQGERAGLWGRGSSPGAALLCPRDCPPPAVPSAIPGPSQCLSIPCPSLLLRRIEELTQELAASNRLVETLSAEKRDLQQRLEEPPAVGGQVGGQAWGDPSPAPWGGAHPPRARLAVVIPVPSGAVAGAVPRPARQRRAFAQLCRSAGGGREDLVRGVGGEATSLHSPSVDVSAACARLPFKSQVLKYPRQPGAVPGGISGLRGIRAACSWQLHGSGHAAS